MTTMAATPWRRNAAAYVVRKPYGRHPYGDKVAAVDATCLGV